MLRANLASASAHGLETISGAPLLVGLLNAIDLDRKAVGLASIDAAGENFLDTHLDHRRGAAELLSDTISVLLTRRHSTRSSGRCAA